MPRGRQRPFRNQQARRASTPESLSLGGGGRGASHVKASRGDGSPGLGLRGRRMARQRNRAMSATQRRRCGPLPDRCLGKRRCGQPLQKLSDIEIERPWQFMSSRRELRSRLEQSFATQWFGQPLL